MFKSASAATSTCTATVFAANTKVDFKKDFMAMRHRLNIGSLRNMDFKKIVFR